MKSLRVFFAISIYTAIKKQPNVRSYIDGFRSRCKDNWNLGEEIFANETMVRYKGNYCQVCQYLPPKPVKWGLKIWCLTGAQSKYVFTFHIYARQTLVKKTWNLPDHSPWRLFNTCCPPSIASSYGHLVRLKWLGYNDLSISNYKLMARHIGIVFCKFLEYLNPNQ